MTANIPSIGDIFEQRYELLEQLGAGGIGTVFKANQIDADRLVALKVLHPHVVTDEEFKIRFLREAQALGKLSHANIVTVYHMGVSEVGLPYLVMELIKGKSLRHNLLDGKPMAPARVFKIMKQLTSALTSIHNEGIVHRDLKPENIVLLNEPEADFVKIIDFGLAKLDNAAGEQKLTSTGILIGSLNYMSPEQCQGKKADARSDIYALTVCMYEMLTGAPPFTADTPIGLMYKHANSQAPELKLETGQVVHPSIAAFVNKGLEKDPARRFQTAAEMEAELNKLLEVFSTSSIGVQATDSRLKIAVIAAVLLLIIISTLIAIKISSTTSEKESPVVARKQSVSAHDRSRQSDLSYLQEVVKRKGSIEGKIKDLLTYRANHGGTAEGLEAVRIAVEIADKDPNKENCASYYAAHLTLGQDANNGLKSQKALDALQPLLVLDENHPPEGTSSHFIYDAKGVAANCYLNLGQEEKAVQMAMALANADEDLPGEGSVGALTVLARMHMYKKAAKVMAHMNNFISLYHACQICRSKKEFGMCDTIIKRTKQILKQPRMFGFTPSNTDEFQIDIEQALLYLDEGRKDKARKFIEEITRNPNYQDIISGEQSGDFNWTLALAMRNAGLYKEAQDMATHVSDSNLQKQIFLSDVLVLQKQFSEARKHLSDATIIIDPETRIRRKALSRLDDIESGKADYTKGLQDYRL